MPAFVLKQVDRIKPNARNQATLYAIASGVMLTMYSAFYGWIKEEIDTSSVLMLRGLIQIVLMAVLNVMTSSKFGPIKPANGEPIEDESNRYVLFIYG